MGYGVKKLETLFFPDPLPLYPFTPLPRIPTSEPIIADPYPNALRAIVHTS
jgi:hypothetical protein